MIVVEVRTCDADDLAELQRRWPTPADVAGSHYAEQTAGHATFLVAWQGDEPVGWAVIHWPGCLGENARAAYPACAEIIHLHVRPEHRNQGAGAALIGAAEHEIRARSVECAAIGVGVENRDAARLYGRLGYERTHVTDISEYTWVDDSGTSHDEREVNELLVKRLTVD